MAVHITTKRLIMRDLEESDADIMFQMDSDPRVLASLFGVPPAASVADSLSAIKRVQQQYKDNGFGRWALIEKASGDVIGWAGLKLEKNVNNHDSFYDLGYRLIPDYWGKGYASEASKALVVYGFENLKVEKICSYIESENVSSRKVSENAGLVLASTFEGERMPEWWLEIKQEDYLSEKKVKLHLDRNVSIEA